jgi:K+-sensing histidine kinase KdpD
MNQTKSISEKNKKLGEFNLKLVESERMKTILTGTIVHDIKNYVSGIEGNLKVIKLRLGKEIKNLRSIDAASAACYDIISLTSNMLDIGRMEEGSLPFNPQKLSFSWLWETFQKICYLPAFTEKVIVTEVDKIEGCFDIDADPALLERVLQNLLNNAAKYTPQGGKVKVTFHNGNHENVISIYNSGEPINSDYKESIFDKYVRVGDNWSSYSKGLGLFFCKMVMNAHNGRIWLDTDESGNYFKLGFSKILNSS